MAKALVIREVDDAYSPVLLLGAVTVPQGAPLLELMTKAG